MISVSCQKETIGDYPIQPVPFTEVQLEDSFWAPRLQTNRNITIPYAFRQCEETGRINNFEIAGGLKEGNFSTKYPFDDSDVYKIIEGASYSLIQNPNPKLEDYLDELISKIGAAQEEDGYLYTARTIDSETPVIWVEGERWSNLRMGHELYNAGHLYEAAAAHYQATGKRNLLDRALNNADLIARVFGPGKKTGVPGHQEIEIGLVKLYRITGDRKYLDLAQFFLDERGNSQGHELYGEYSQDHIPITQQKEAVGHAVRACYMYSAMADVAALTKDESYIRAIDRLWKNVVSKKMYLTGGVGAAGDIEGFGKNYQLPNDTAYCETCASIANALWNHRMFLLHGDSRYIDVLERVIYNGVLSGISLEGDRFFYPNPLLSHGEHQRSPWFSCACCPSNITRFVPSIPGFVYAVKKKTIYVNLFIQGKGQIEIPHNTIQLKQKTAYPWKGDVEIKVNPEKRARWTLNIRIPGWARNQPVPSELYTYSQSLENKPVVTVNGEQVALNLKKGYLPIKRKWQKNDTIHIHFPLPVRRVKAHPAVQADQGRVALERGPLVYCAEWVDNGGGVTHFRLKKNAKLETQFRPQLLNGVTIVKGKAEAYYKQESELKKEEKQIILIPYYSWAHRGNGEMAVWLAQEKEKVKPKPEPEWASQSKMKSTGTQGN